MDRPHDDDVEGHRLAANDNEIVIDDAEVDGPRPAPSQDEDAVDA